MATLYHVANQAEPGDKIRWRGSNSDIETPQPRTVTKVVLVDDHITIEAAGPNGGRAGFRVDADGTSEAWYGEDERPMGEVEIAELMEKNCFTEPWTE